MPVHPTIFGKGKGCLSPLNGGNLCENASLSLRRRLHFNRVTYVNTRPTKSEHPQRLVVWIRCRRR